MDSTFSDATNVYERSGKKNIQLKYRSYDMTIPSMVFIAPNNIIGKNTYIAPPPDPPL